MPIGIYLDRNSVFTFQSSLGADITYDYQTCGLSLRCSMAEGEKKFSAAWQRGCTRFEELKDLTDEIRASMREQAAASAIRKLRPLSEKAREQAEKGGKLLMQLGLLFGLMLGMTGSCALLLLISITSSVSAVLP